MNVKILSFSNGIHRWHALIDQRHHGNVGLGNVGDFNLGAGNVGGFNVGGGNIGGNNVGLGNVGWGNFGLGNSGLTPGLMGLGNIGFGNAGSYNFGLANMGVGNIGFANTGSGNFGIGLTGDNLTGFGGFNTGSGNVGLFNSGTGEKIHDDHQCLYCGQLKHTASGIQTHMRDRGHCMIPYSTEDEMLEIGEFYDFRSTYSDDEDDESTDGADDQQEGGVKLGAARATKVTIEKIHDDHQCLYCGQLKHTASGIQTHMRDRGHCITPAVRPDVTCPNDTAADPNSSASPSHAAAAASNGLDPAPEYISTELISGGRTGKFNRPYLCRSRCVHTSSSHHDVVSAGTSTN